MKIGVVGKQKNQVWIYVNANEKSSSQPSW